MGQNWGSKNSGVGIAATQLQCSSCRAKCKNLNLKAAPKEERLGGASAEHSSKSLF